ncbi:calcium-transporting ATPase 12, plasma membrane-type-like [Cornus florida]|uniref:calcium-transporting ATPase 12, plasma membrane-type-like n=1 Tax=Cornus florida TaxID=4283 RepID=UPI0028A0249A|nr:calcium-transporting ATPase 12, plasma membrane-type-like [Cornus florida]
MAYHQSCNTILEKDNFNDSTTPQSRVVQEIEDCPIDENHKEDGLELEVINFGLSQEKLAELVELNDINYIHQHYGGINGIAAALDTNIHTGIRGDGKDLRCRHEAFGSNLNFEDKSSSNARKGTLYWLMCDAFKDSTVILLLCCATLSLVIGIKRNGLEEGIVDGAIMILAIDIVVIFSVISIFRKARRNKMIKQQLSREKTAISKVIRGGKVQLFAVHEVVVGDIVCLKTGDTVPADGLFIDGGDSFKLGNGLVHEGNIGYLSKYPSMFTGEKVVGGECQMLVMTVGRNTEKSKLMRSISSDESDRESRLLIAMDKTNFRLEKIWLSLSLFVLVVQVLRCFVLNSGQCDQNHDPDPKGVKNTVEEIMNEATKLIRKQQGTRANGLVPMLCILIFALRDGLTLGFFILLACGKKKMMSSGKVIVQKLPACSTIGFVTAICTGETDDLSLQHRKMAELWIGFDNVKEVSTGVLAHEVLDRLREGVYCMCSPSEDALLCWSQQVLGNIDIEELSRNCSVLDSEAFGLNRNESVLMLRRKEESDKVVHVHLKGAAKMVLSKCSHYYKVDGTIKTLDERERALFNEIIETIESDCLQCFAFAHKKVLVVQEEGEQTRKLGKDEEETLKSIEDGLILLGLLGLKNPYGQEVRQAIEACKKSGVKIKLVVDKDIKTAAFMAVQSGILRSAEEMEGVVEASEFRNSSEEDRMSMIDRISVMAKASPADKLLMVQCLRQKGVVVAVTGTSTRDSLLLQEADLGLLIGHNGAESAQESSDIVVLDRTFVTFYAILKMGRCVCNNLKKFIQLQLSLNIVAFMTNFIVVLFASEVPLTPFKILWLNLIMDILGASALAAPPPSRVQLESCPPAFPISGPFITKTMWTSIAVKSLYQVTVLLVLHFKGQAIFHVDERVLKAMIFNCYVLCQVFALMNAREMEKMNVFEGILMRKSLRFHVMVVAIVTMQVVVINIATAVTHSDGRLGLKEWGVCIGIAATVLPVGWGAKWVTKNNTQVN